MQPATDHGASTSSECDFSVSRKQANRPQIGLKPPRHLIWSGQQTRLKFNIETRVRTQLINPRTGKEPAPPRPYPGCHLSSRCPRW